MTAFDLNLLKSDISYLLLFSTFWICPTNATLLCFPNLPMHTNPQWVCLKFSGLSRINFQSVGKSASHKQLNSSLLSLHKAFILFFLPGRIFTNFTCATASPSLLDENLNLLYTFFSFFKLHLVFSAFLECRKVRHNWVSQTALSHT